MWEYPGFRMEHRENIETASTKIIIMGFGDLVPSVILFYVQLQTIPNNNVAKLGQ